MDFEKPRVVRKGSYQGVPQWGLANCAAITPSRATAEKWAALELAALRASRKAR